RLVGAPPGYVGYEEGGQLTEKVRRRPYSVVLLDEIEKAHPDVFNMLLQIMEEGRLTDSFGRHVDFRNVILIMTSNLGSHLMTSGGGLGFGKTDTKASEEDKMKKIRADVLSEVQRQFRPEFLNRVDELVVFNPLTEEDLKRIVHIQLKDVLERAADRGLELQLDDKAIHFLISHGFNADYGARPLRRAIERFIEDPLAEEVLRLGEDASRTVAISVEGDPEKAEELSFESTEKVAEPEPEPEPAASE
ncbi:MAG TPA: NDP-hexose 4-ketoreductase, partial [Planctomycetes bacterium]|nr:NDP-hexose 4-ketoreductase [Planctomycetota bacterium]